MKPRLRSCGGDWLSGECRRWAVQYPDLPHLVGQKLSFTRYWQGRIHWALGSHQERNLRHPTTRRGNLQATREFVPERRLGGGPICDMAPTASIPRAPYSSRTGEAMVRARATKRFFEVPASASGGETDREPDALNDKTGDRKPGVPRPTCKGRDPCWVNLKMRQQIAHRRRVRRISDAATGTARCLFFTIKAIFLRLLFFN